MPQLKINKVKLKTTTQETYEDVSETKKQTEEVKPVSSTTKLQLARTNKSKIVATKENPQIEDSVQKDATSQNNSKPESPAVRLPYKIIDKTLIPSNKTGFGNLVELSRSALSLRHKDKNGYDTSLDGKMLLTFVNYELKNNSQLSKIPAYIPVSDWLVFTNMIKSGEIFELTELAKKQNCEIWSSQGGSESGIYTVDRKQYGYRQTVACVTKLKPAMKKDCWMISAEIWPGERDKTHRIKVKAGAKLAKKIEVVIDYDTLMKWSLMSEMIIQAYYSALFTHEMHAN